MENDDDSAACLISIDFAKAFNKMSHTSCVEAFTKGGASDHMVGLVRAFLTGRKMRMKVGNSFSSLRNINGGSPQGTLLGNYLFIITTDHLETDSNNEPSENSEKTMSDVSFNTAEENPDLEEELPDIDESFVHLNEQMPAETTTSTINSSADEADDPRLTTFDEQLERPEKWKTTDITVLKYVDDFLGIEKIYTGGGFRSISQHKTEILTRALQSERFYRTVEGNATSIGMSVNANKTQLICISPALYSNNNTFVKLHETEIITSQSELKILGFHFGTRPDIIEQIKKISLKFRKRVWVLRHLKKANIPTTDLIKLYQSLILPVLDYTAVTYHSMLSQTQAKLLENLQKLALKIIYGVTGIQYVILLERSGLPTLAERRTKLVDGFIKKAVQNSRYKDWFPTKTFFHHDLRKEQIYIEKYARTSRLYKSPLYYFRRRLNKI